jgi:DNA-binding NtrC family response regulator
MVNIKESDINIYIVDDDELLSKILRTKFEQEGDFKIISFTTGEEFLEYFGNNQFNKRQIHIVILDYLFKSNVNPQAKNGLEILKSIREVNKDIEVIMLSGLDDVDIASKAIKCGAISFVKKNENSFLRIQNNVKFIISQNRLKLTQKQSRYTRQLFLILIALIMGFAIYYVLTEFVLN